MSTKQKFSREVRNGKVVYLPLPARSPMAPQRRRATARRPARPQVLTLQFGGAAAFGLLGTVGLGLGGLIWLSWQTLSNPDMAFWLNQFAPSNPARAVAVEQPLTLTQIQHQIRQTGWQSAGEPLVLSADFNFRSPLKAARDVLIPVSRSSCTPEPCQKLQELRIYRTLELPYLLRLLQGERYYHLLDRFQVVGPTGIELRKQLRQNSATSQSLRPLAVEYLDAYEDAPQPGHWLRLSGLRSQGQATSAHGQILYFHPEETHLSVMLNWVSPQGKLPVWQQVTGNEQLELLVDQSIGLEPDFALYQTETAPRGVQQLRPIELTRAAFRHPLYNQALILARHGLWHQAHQRLLTLKQQQPQQWSPTAQAHLDLIRLHAQVTQAQARQRSIYPVQRIVALLIHGAWTEALEIFNSPNTSMADVRAMLAGDNGRLWDRVTAALAVKSGQTDAIAWGALLLEQQQDRPAALNWARKQTRKPATLNKVETLLKQLQTQPKSASHKSESSSTVPAPKLASPAPAASPPALPTPITPQPQASPLVLPPPSVPPSDPADIPPTTPTPEAVDPDVPDAPALPREDSEPDLESR